MERYFLEASGCKHLPCDRQIITDALNLFGIKPHKINVEGNTYYFEAKAMPEQDGVDAADFLGKYGNFRFNRLETVVMTHDY